MSGDFGAGAAVLYFCLDAEGLRLGRMGDGHGNVRLFGEAGTLECIEIVNKRCTGRRGANTQRVAVCLHPAASGHIDLAWLIPCKVLEPPTDGGTSTQVKLKVPQGPLLVKPLTSHVFTFSVTVTLPPFNEPPDTLMLEAGIEPKPE
jgi:hypothetical protein